MDYTTRKLLKILKLTPDQVYHVFCLALCLTCADGKVTAREGELLTRLGFGLGLSPEDIQALLENAARAVQETSAADVIAFSVASLGRSLDADRLAGIRQILEYVASADRRLSGEERQLLAVIDEAWHLTGNDPLAREGS